MATEPDSGIDKVGGSEEDWSILSNQLETEHYTQVAKLLQKAYIISDQIDGTVISQVLTVAYQMGLVLVIYQTETGRLAQAQQEAYQREQDLKQNLQIILDTLSHVGRLKIRRVSDREAPILPKPKARSGLLQRLQSLLGLESLSAESDGPLIEEQTPIVSSTEKPETPLISSTEMGEADIPTPSAIETIEASSPQLPIEETDIVSKPPPDKIELSSPDHLEQAEVSLPSITEAENLPDLVIYCLGPFRVYQNDELITEWNGLKSLSILKYLILHNGGPVAKDILMDIFWPGVDPGDTRRNLHQAIYNLRQTLRRRQSLLKPILFKSGNYLLNPDMALWLDFEEFERHVRAGQQLDVAGQSVAAIDEYSNAEILYQGDFLEEDIYEDWAMPQRNYFRNLYLDITEYLTQHYFQQGEYTSAMAICQKILYQDNCREEAHRCLMQCYLARGQRHLAVRQYQTCVQALLDELDLPPSEETSTLYHQVIAR